MKKIKIGVVADTHIAGAGQDIPQKILEEFKDADMIIHAGDLTDMIVLERLRKVCRNIKAVCGNMDSGEVKNRLSEKEIFSVGNFKIGVMHGWGPAERLLDRMKEAFNNTAVDIIIFGHSHAALNLKKEGILYFNPGSPTDTAYAAYNSFGILEINDKIEARIIRL